VVGDEAGIAENISSEAQTPPEIHFSDRAWGVLLLAVGLRPGRLLMAGLLPWEVWLLTAGSCLVWVLAGWLIFWV